MGMVLSSLSALAQRFTCSPQRVLDAAKTIGAEPSMWLDAAPLWEEVDAERIGAELQARRMAKTPAAEAQRMTKRQGTRETFEGHAHRRRRQLGEPL